MSDYFIYRFQTKITCFLCELYLTKTTRLNFSNSKYIIVNEKRRSDHSVFIKNNKASVRYKIRIIWDFLTERVLPVKGRYGPIENTCFTDILYL